jgi:hypothetical protein
MQTVRIGPSAHLMLLSEKNWHLGVPKAIGAKMLDGVLRILAIESNEMAGLGFRKPLSILEDKDLPMRPLERKKYDNRLAVSIWTNLRASVAAVNARGNRPKGFISFRNFIVIVVVVVVVLVFVVVAILVLPATAFSS